MTTTKKKKENRKTIHHNMRVSEEAFAVLKKKAAEDPAYKGRGLVGVVDDLVLGRFTTIGSGRVDNPRSAKREDLKKSSKDAKKSEKPVD